MLTFEIKKILKVRGIDEPYRWLVKNGFVPATVHSWLNYQLGYIKPDHLERLCLLLNCTPNDLFDWREDGKTVVHDTHALRSLTKQKNDIQTTLRELPLDKLEKLGEMLAKLRSSDEQNDAKI